ncbi:hypothetical protein V1507DRAFT_306436 [Lipomyces tetrasporus]
MSNFVSRGYAKDITHLSCRVLWARSFFSVILLLWSGIEYTSFGVQTLILEYVSILKVGHFFAVICTCISVANGLDIQNRYVISEDNKVAWLTRLESSQAP